MPGRCGVHHHLVVVARGRQPLELDQADQLVDPGQRLGEQLIDVLVVEVGPARGEHPESALAPAEPAEEGTVRVQLGREQPS